MLLYCDAYSSRPAIWIRSDMPSSVRFSIPAYGMTSADYDSASHDVGCVDGAAPAKLAKRSIDELRTHTRSDARAPIVLLSLLLLSLVLIILLTNYISSNTHNKPYYYTATT